MPSEPRGRLVTAHDTELFVVERGTPEGLPLLVLHGGPGLDHTMFGDHLDGLGSRFRLVLIDGRGQGRSNRDSDPASWTLQQHASDASAVAAALGAERYAVLGHSYGASVALQHAADAPGAAVATVISSGVEGGDLTIDVEAALPHVPQPLLACTGRHDRICAPAASARIAELAPKGELHVFEQAGHLSFVESTQEYLQVVGDFLDRATA